MTDLLIRLDERTKNINDKVTQVHESATGKGWSRCMIYEARLKSLEEDKQERQDDLRWFKRAIVGSFLALVSSLVMSVISLLY